MGSDIATAVFGLYSDYVDVKLHFNGTRGIGKVRRALTPAALMRRPDFSVFLNVLNVLGRNRRDNFELMITTFLADPNGYVTDIVKDENRTANLHRIQRLRSLETLFFDDLNKMVDIANRDQIDFLDLVMTGRPVPIIKYFRQRVFHEETAVLLHSITGFCEVSTRDPMWERRRVVIPRYLDFVRPYIDVAATQTIVKSTLISNRQED